jgi:ribonuclease R
MTTREAVPAVTRDQLLAFMRAEVYRPVLLDELAAGLGVPPEGRDALARLLEELVEAGSVVRTHTLRYGLPDRMNLVVGRVVVHPDGYGFLVPEDRDDGYGGSDLFLGPRTIKEVMHGDRVVARVERSRRDGGGFDARVIRVLERARTRVVGRYEVSRAFGYVVPHDKRLVQDIVIPADGAGKAASGDLVVAELSSYPSERGAPEGRIVEVLGKPGEPSAEAELIIRKHELPHRFGRAAQDEAARVARERAPAEADVTASARVDLRDIPLVTIDGETARDFDDAVAVEALPDGRTRLYVAIADVSHYVLEGSSLDREAYERGTSVYFPDRAIPMLPEVLSNEVCSLNPHVDRYCFTAELLFDAEGKPAGAQFYPAVMRSHARLTYTLVRRMVADREPELREKYGAIATDLDVAVELAERLRARRRQRGSVDFDLPEPQIVLDLEGGIEAIVRSERNVAHQLIEEFMLAANEAVARFLGTLGVPTLYRVHEEPAREKIDMFREFLQNLGYTLGGQPGGPVHPKMFQKLVDAARGRPEERLVNTVLLRTMKQARYSAENIGHFGLAATDYLHFTSPIRRYPDLVAHRILREVHAGGAMPASRREALDARLPDAGKHCSDRERKAMDAEREIVALKKCQFMAGKVGDEFDGVVSGVAAFGFFVELAGVFVEGLVRVSSLSDDFYTFVEGSHALVGQHTRRTFRIGDRVRVQVARVDVDARHIDFALLGEAGVAAAENGARARQTGKTARGREKRKARAPKGAALVTVGAGPAAGAAGGRGKRGEARAASKSGQAKAAPGKSSSKTGGPGKGRAAGPAAGKGARPGGAGTGPGPDTGGARAAGPRRGRRRRG